MALVEEVLVLTNGDERKTCPTCGRRLPYEMFWRCRKTADTLQRECKDCQRRHKQMARINRNLNRAIFREIPLGDLAELAKAVKGKDKRDLVRYLSELINHLK